MSGEGSVSMSGTPRTWSFVDDETGVCGWVALDALVGGLAFGGMRVSAETSKEEVEELAHSMTRKLFIHDSPVGGAKAGLAISPSDPRLEGVLKRFAKAMEEPLSGGVTLGKDMGTTNTTLDRLYEGFGRPQLHLIGGEGVPERLRDFVGYRRHMTGLGVAWASAALLGRRISEARVAIQGFGAVGVGAAVRLTEMGARVVAVSDHRHCWCFEGALSRPTIEAMASAGRVRPHMASVEATRCGRDSLLAQEVDLLVLAANSNSVSAEVAETIRASVVVEGSNFGLTKEAREVLLRKGVEVIPDLIASSSSAAMVANQLANRGDLGHDELWIRIEDCIRDGVKRYHSLSERGVRSIRQALIDEIEG